MSAIRRPADIARRSAKALAGRDAFRRETFVLSREAAREKASSVPQGCLHDGDRMVARVAR